MKRKELNFVLFSLAGSFVVLAGASSMTYLALSNKTLMSDYPTARYSDYEDASSSHIFDEDYGTHLFEAETLNLSGPSTVSENIHASKQEVVSSLSTGATLNLSFESKSSCSMKLVFSTSYQSLTNHTIPAENLFNVLLNSHSQQLSGSITPSYNEFDFIENDIALLQLKKGRNDLTILSYDDSYTLDYLLLVPENERKKECLKSPLVPRKFNALEHQQIYEAEIQNDSEGCVVIPQYDCESQYAMLFTNPRDFVSFPLESDDDTDTSLVLRVKKEKNHSSPGISLRINGEEINSSPIIKIQEVYQDIDFGTISLKKGINSLEISNLSGYFYLDSISLNADINFSNQVTSLLLEAEDQKLVGGCSTVVANTVPSQAAVGYNMLNSYVEFNLKCKEQSTSYLALNLSYTGKALPLNEILSIQVNGYEIQAMSHEILSSTGTYSNYVTVYGGKFSLPKGNNVLRIISKSGNYNLDYVTFFHSSLDQARDYLMIEAEDMIQEGGALINLDFASNSKYIHLEKGNRISFYFYSEREEIADLELFLSSILSLQNAESLFNLRINQKAIDIFSIEVPKAEKNSDFSYLSLGEIKLAKGMNQLSLEALSSFNLDYLLLTL